MNSTFTYKRQIYTTKINKAFLYNSFPFFSVSKRIHKKGGVKNSSTLTLTLFFIKANSSARFHLEPWALSFIFTHRFFYIIIFSCICSGDILTHILRATWRILFPGRYFVTRIYRASRYSRRHYHKIKGRYFECSRVFFVVVRGVMLW